MTGDVDRLVVDEREHVTRERLDIVWTVRRRRRVAAQVRRDDAAIERGEEVVRRVGTVGEAVQPEEWAAATDAEGVQRQGAVPPSAWKRASRAWRSEAGTRSVRHVKRSDLSLSSYLKPRSPRSESMSK